ncbi:MAG TPA: 5-methyltetrahydropteroyltriglutamate--homocysteine methyltransferase [Thermoanaerobaculia bacterium]|nr:5-methyltetrahydropteroyltriglutamate--homocysteine methyltransferase [Thermoanaerobaculia bacterium]
MTLPTEPIGSMPRPAALIEGVQAAAAGQIAAEKLEALFDDAVRDTIRRFEETGSPVITDGEQRKPSFATYPVHGLANLAPGGVTIPFKDGHTRQLPVLTAGPFRYATHAAAYLDAAKRYARVPLKEAVISASALSLLYPQEGIPGYTREAFLEDLVGEAEADIRQCLDRDATVQIDFTEGRLSVKLDPSKALLDSFVDLNNQVLERFTAEQRRRIGVHTCPGGDRDSTHSADVDYAELFPALFRMNVGNFFIQLASERDRPRVLATLGKHATGDRRIFVGVTDPIDPRVETPEKVRDRVLEAAKFIPPSHFGTTDDCGFSPFGDDTSTSRETAFAKVRARVTGTEMASRILGV